MAEDGGAGRFYVIDYFFALMAAGAFREGEGFFPVVAGTARFTFFHVGHSVMLFLFQVKQPVVTGPAIIGHAFVEYMDGVSEYYFAGIFGVIDRIPYGDSKGCTLE